MAHLSIERETCDADLFAELEQLLEVDGMSKEDVCIVGSTCLAIRGLRTHSDIDACDNPNITQSTKFEGGRYEILGISDRELFNCSKFTDTINGWKIVRPEIEYCYKKQRRRDKDKTDINLLEDYKMKSEEWDYQLESDYSLSTPRILWLNFWRSIRQNGLLTTIRRTLDILLNRN